MQRAFFPSKVVQHVYTESGAMATGAVIIPLDDTIPQSGEGVEFMTLAITPRNVNNILLISVVGVFSAAAGSSRITGALFQDAGASAIAAAVNTVVSTGNFPSIIKFSHFMAAGVAVATTFKFRAGPQAATTITFNGAGGARLLGGVMASSMSIFEVRP